MYMYMFILLIAPCENIVQNIFSFKFFHLWSLVFITHCLETYFFSYFYLKVDLVVSKTSPWFLKWAIYCQRFINFKRRNHKHLYENP